ncbi:hypothetical protein D3C79_756060 [compost metagenome]
MLLGQGLHVLGGDVYRVDTLQGADANVQGGRPQVVQAAGRVLLGQAFLDQALQIAVGGRAAGSGAPSDLPQRQLTLGIGQDLEKTHRDRHRLNSAGALFRGCLRFFVQGGHLIVQLFALLAGAHGRACWRP